MAQILVRNIDERLKARLQRRAKRNGRSMEAEAREILRNELREKDARNVDWDRKLWRSSAGKGLGSERAKRFLKLRGFPLNRSSSNVIILDTNVISEFMRDAPDPECCPLAGSATRSFDLDHFNRRFRNSFWADLDARWKDGRHCVCFFERLLNEIIQAAHLPHSIKRRSARPNSPPRGQPRGAREPRDTMIAGIVLASHATLATRNVKHFEDIAKSVVNPWEA